MIGRTLAHYKILEKMGSGGMGVVYRAEDTKLGRHVALKVLPAAFLEDEERRARFGREARILASLNHPNIAALYSLEQEDGVDFLVLELVEGETLAERIARGPLRLEEALPLFRQIAEALEGAHGKGVVHRDLKPSNIKIAPGGKVKVLDFGLAKASMPDASSGDLSQSPTISRHVTESGVILGTAAYMSPEQARGDGVDKRADIWGFGCVLFEALTGRVAFAGDTLSDTLASVLKSEPDWEKLPETTPAGIRVLLRRCLQKDPERRLRDIGDARLEIEDAQSGAPELIPVGTVTAKPEARWQRAVPWALAALAAGAWLFWRSPEVPRAVVRTSIVLPAEGRRSLAISPDGTTLVYGTRAEKPLYVRHLDQEESKPIPGTEGADTPFFSPDGEWVGFFTFKDGLKKVRLDGVGAVALSEGAARGGSWVPDGTIVFAGGRMSGLTRISAGGGTLEALTTLDPDQRDLSHRWPQLLPNGRAVLFTAYSGGDWKDTPIVAQSLSTGERRVVAKGAQGRYVSTGHLVYAAGGTLYAVPFNPDRLEVKGNGVPVLVGVGEWGSGEHYFAISETGTLIYVPAAPKDRRLVLVDLEGRVEPLAAPAGPYAKARFSPDGRQLAVSTDDNKFHLYELEHERFSLLFSSITDQAGSVWTASSMEWSPDGTRLAVAAERPGSGVGSAILIVPVDGRGPVEQVTSGPESKFIAAWSPDGKRLLYGEQEREREFFHVWEVSREPKVGPRLLVKTDGSSQLDPVFSPDGRWLAYSSSESGRREVYVRPYRGAGGSRQISIEGGENPLWAPDGREVYYHSGQKMMAVTISREPTFSAGRPRELFEGAYAHLPLTPTYDLSPDGRKFVMIENADAPKVTEIRVVQNWTEELKRLVPTR